MIAVIIFIALVFGVYYLYYAIKAKVKGVSINKAVDPNYKTEQEKQQLQKEKEERRRKYPDLYASEDDSKSSELLDDQQYKERNKQARKEAWDKLTAPKQKKPHYVRNTLLFGIFGTMYSSHVDHKNEKQNK